MTFKVGIELFIYICIFNVNAVKAVVPLLSEKEKGSDLHPLQRGNVINTLLGLAMALNLA